MNTIQETKGRLRGLSLALATILDNYGVNSNQQPEYNVARQELEDIIANMADVPPPAPVTVSDVTADITGTLTSLSTRIEVAQESARIALDGLADKVNALVALANAHGASVQQALQQ